MYSRNKPKSLNNIHCIKYCIFSEYVVRVVGHLFGTHGSLVHP